MQTIKHKRGDTLVLTVDADDILTDYTILSELKDSTGLVAGTFTTTLLSSTSIELKLSTVGLLVGRYLFDIQFTKNGIIASSDTVAVRLFSDVTENITGP